MGDETVCFKFGRARFDWNILMLEDGRRDVLKGFEGVDGIKWVDVGGSRFEGYFG